MTVWEGHKQIITIDYEGGNKGQICLGCGCEEYDVASYPTCEAYLEFCHKENPHDSYPEGQSEPHYCRDCGSVMYCSKRKSDVMIRCINFKEKDAPDLAETLNNLDPKSYVNSLTGQTQWRFENGTTHFR